MASSRHGGRSMGTRISRLSGEAREASLDELGQPIGPAVPRWEPRSRPPRSPIRGRLVRVEPLDPERHVEDLFAAFRQDREGRIWTYLPYGPFETLAAY